MNNVVLIGRLTKDPVVRYTSGNQTAVTEFALAVDRPVRQGEEKKADFPRVIVFGKQAENCGKYLRKGLMLAVAGRIQTGSYKNRDGNTVYTTDVIANRVMFLEWAGENNGERGRRKRDSGAEAERREERLGDQELPDMFEEIADDVPF